MYPMALDYRAHSYQGRAKVPPLDGRVAGSLGLELSHHPLELRLLHQQERAGPQRAGMAEQLVTGARFLILFCHHCARILRGIKGDTIPRCLSFPIIREVSSYGREEQILRSTPYNQAWQTWEHSALNGMSLSNPFPQESKNHREEEAECKSWGRKGQRTPIKHGPLMKMIKAHTDTETGASLTEPTWDLCQFYCILWFPV